MSLSILGSVAFDTLHTPKGTREKIPGGSAFYASIAASFFSKVAIISKVGGDYPKDYFDLLCNREIDVTNIQIDKNAKNVHWTGSYLNNINLAETINTEIGVLADFTPNLNEEATRNPICFCANNDPVSQRQALEQSNAKLKALDTMNLWINTMEPELNAVLSLINMLFINDAEIKMLTKEYSLLNAVRKIQSLFPNINYVILKKGEYGASLYGKKEDEIFTTGAYPLTSVKDPTGAGDSFAGGFLGYLDNANYSWETLKKSLLIGTATSSFTVEEFGPDSLLNTNKKSITERYNRLISLLSL